MPLLQGFPSFVYAGSHRLLPVISLRIPWASGASGILMNAIRVLVLPARKEARERADKRLERERQNQLKAIKDLIKMTSG